MCREQQSVDFKKVDAHVHQFKGSSARYTYNFIKDSQKMYKLVEYE